MAESVTLENKVLQSLKLFRDEVADLYLPKQIATINYIPEPLEFYRNWVAPNLPVVIKGGIKKWPAFVKWNREYFCNKFKNKKISVAVTPDGYADSLTQIRSNNDEINLFVLPEERLITFDEFYDALENSKFSGTKTHGVFYIQKQNSNLTEEFPELLPDIDETLLWASASFQTNPTAINLWIGDEKAITSLHKDPFENIYCVVSGHKEFTLLAPTDRPWLPYITVPVGQYKEKDPGVFDILRFDSDSWKAVNSDKVENLSRGSDNDKNCVPWIAIDPTCPDYEKYPLYKYATPIKVKLEAGDILYVPSLWFHYVKQSHECIAVNYWYDMNLDIKYAYFQLLDTLSNICTQVPS